MKHVVIAAATVVAIVASAAGAARNGGSDPYGQARTWDLPLGQLYGPVQAGPPASSSYGFVAK